jgi:predicted ribosome quality control (RQC) complex YloA/Tae2 family protein
MKTIIFENFDINIGRNAQENWNLLDNTTDEDILFHLTSFPSPYVILTANGKDIPTIVINKCAQLCKQYSKYKRMYPLKVDYSVCANIHKGEKTGEFYYKSKRKVMRVGI